jgi:hypothetical protein
MIGMLAAFGVAVAYGLIELVSGARSVLIIIGLALFAAAGLDPVVGWLVRHRVPRWAAVLVVIGCAAAVAAGFLAAAIPPLASGPIRGLAGPARRLSLCGRVEEAGPMTGGSERRDHDDAVRPIRISHGGCLLVSIACTCKDKRNQA